MEERLDAARCSLAPKQGAIEEIALGILRRDVGEIGLAGGDRVAPTLSPFAGA